MIEILDYPIYFVISNPASQARSDCEAYLMGKIRKLEKIPKLVKLNSVI
jgi:hypothetical protein